MTLGSVERLNKFIYRRHKKFLKNTATGHQTKIMVCFSSVPRAGKTTLAQKIEKKYKAIRLNNDHVRDIVNANQIGDPSMEIIIENYLKWLIEKLEKGKNKFIILDSSIDRKYKKIKKIAQQYHYPLFIIQIDITKKIFKERVRELPADNRNGYMSLMNSWFIDHQNFKKHNNLKKNIILVINGNTDTKIIFGKIQKLLAKYI